MTHPIYPSQPRQPNYLFLSTLLALSLSSTLAHSADISTLQLLGQSEFRQLSEDLGAALSFKPLIPAESLGITGFDIGLSATATKLGDRGVWRKATANSDVPGYLPIPSLRLHKGLPFDIDIGATATIVPSSNIRIYGGELRWAVLPGSTVTPALALRASFTALNGVDQLDMRTMGLDASVSKGFAFLTPYAGIGSVHINSKPNGSTALAKESFYRTKVFVGANLNFGLLNFAGEADRTGDITSYGVKMGFRF
jgi:hypothetical protein